MSVISTLLFDLDMTVFAQRLKAFREQRKLTQTRLAELLAVSPRVYNRWEHGEATPHLDTVVKIADILEVSLDELAGRVEAKASAAINNPKLHELYQRVNELADADQQALIILIDSVIARAHMDKVVGRSQQLRR